MISAYILIVCDINSANDVIEILKQNKSISEASKVDGPYDIIIKASHNNNDKLREMVNQEIKKIEKIKHVLVLIIKEEQ